MENGQTVIRARGTAPSEEQMRRTVGAGATQTETDNEWIVGGVR